MASAPNRKMKLTDVRANFSELLNEVHRDGTRVSITKSGLPIGALISIRDLKRLQNFEEARERDFAILDEIGSELADVPWEEIEAEADRAVADLRADRAAETNGTKPPQTHRAVAEPAEPGYDTEAETTGRDQRRRRGVA